MGFETTRSLDDKSDCENEQVTFSFLDKLSKPSVKVGNIPLSMIIDSEASCNVIALKTWNNLNKQKDFKFISKSKTEKKIFPYGSKKALSLAGMFKAQISENDNCLITDFLVLKGTGQLLLSCKTAVNIENTVMPIWTQFPNLFRDEIWKVKDYQLKIPIDDTINHIVQQTRRIPYNLRDKLEKKNLIS